jgi:antitoxin VapB
MVHLSPETEALARRLALAQGLSIEQAIKQALEQSARAAGIASQPQQRSDNSPKAVAARMARIDQVVDDLANMPVLDRRSPREIMSDLNAL